MAKKTERKNLSTRNLLLVHPTGRGERSDAAHARQPARADSTAIQRFPNPSMPSPSGTAPCASRAARQSAAVPPPGHALPPSAASEAMPHGAATSTGGLHGDSAIFKSFHAVPCGDGPAPAGRVPREATSSSFPISKHRRNPPRTKRALPSAGPPLSGREGKSKHTQSTACSSPSHAASEATPLAAPSPARAAPHTRRAKRRRTARQPARAASTAIPRFSNLSTPSQKGRPRAPARSLRSNRQRSPSSERRRNPPRTGRALPSAGPPLRAGKAPANTRNRLPVLPPHTRRAKRRRKTPQSAAVPPPGHALPPSAASAATPQNAATRQKQIPRRFFTSSLPSQRDGPARGARKKNSPRKKPLCFL